GLWRRSRGGEVLRHQGSIRKTAARGGGRGGHRARPEDERRRKEGCTREGGRRRTQTGAREPGGACQKCSEVRCAGYRGAQPLYLLYRRRAEDGARRCAE